MGEKAIDVGIVKNTDFRDYNNLKKKKRVFFTYFK